MAPAMETSYFPSLGKILGGHEQLISWETAAIGLSTIGKDNGDSKLARFILDQISISILCNVTSAFRPGTSQTKAAFDTRTAAINITPDTKGQYNLDEIKRDSLWLAKEAKIDEVTALRITILEWQTRIPTRILAGVGDQESTDVGAFASSIFSASPQLQSFDSKESRRARILKIYFSERVFLIKTSEILLQSSPAQQTASARHQEDKGEPRSHWIEQVATALFKTRTLDNGKNSERHQPFLQECIGALRDRLDSLEAGSGISIEDIEEVELLWAKSQIVEMIHIMQAMFVMIGSSPRITSSTALLAWLRFIDTYGSFDSFEPPFQSLQYLVTPLQSLVSIVSLSILRLPLVVNRISEAGQTESRPSSHTPYIVDLTNMAEINQIFMNIAEARSNTASPAVLAWSIILQTLRETVLSRKEARELRQSMKAINGFEEEATETEVDSSTTDTGESRSRRRQSGDSDLSLQPTVYDEVLQAVSSHRLKEDSIRFLARSAGGDCQVFDIIINLVSNYEACFGSDGITGTCNEVRLLLLELIQSSVQAVEYLPDVVLATLAVLTTRKTAQALDPATMFLNDAVLMGNTFKAAISRFPYEIIPFLRLLRALSTSREVDTEGTLKATTILEEMKTFTQALPIGFEDYTTTYEDRNENFVRLIRTLDVFEQRTSQGLIPIEDKALVSKDHSFVIPMDTLGRIVTDQKPAVGLWCIEYSGLYYLGRLLQTGLSGSNTVDHGTGKPLDHDSTAEIIGLLTDLMTNSIQANGDRAAAQGILEEASDGLEQTSDIITVIFDIFEEHLESHIQDRSTDVLSNCMDFISALIQILPGRVWPFLARSSLLEIDGTGGNLVAVVAGSEMPFGRFDFLLASIRVYDGLVEDAVVHAVARKTIQTGRHNRPEVLEAGVPDQVVKKVLDAFQRIMVDVLQNSSNWKFVSNDDRHRLCESLLTTFDRVLFYCYAIDDTADSQTKVTGVLASAAEYILDVYLSSGNDVPVDQLLEMISAGTMTPSTTLFPRSLSLWISQVSTALEFATSLVQLRRLTDRQPSYLEAQLFDTAPVLVRIYVGHFSYRMPVLNLLRRLVLAAADSSEPPSLLGHLGPDTAKDFLEILSRLDAPLDDGDVYNGIWDLLSAVVSGGQQWFSVYLLTGKTPRGTLKDQRGTDKLARPMLQAALDAATLTLSSSKNLAILKFIARSVDCWPWSINDLRKHPSFITTTIKYVDELQPPSGSQTDAQNLQTCEQISIAALAAQILAMYNHFSRQMGDSSATKTVSHHIRYYVENAVNLPNYNLSLHGNLKRNFEMKYSCMLSSFKKTHFTRQILGRDFFYDTEIADKMLSFDEAWHGKRGNNGLALEVQKANINLSIVQSQVTLLRNWKLLAIELTTAIKESPALVESLSSVPKQCLRSNVASNVPESIFHQLTQTRADLALTLMQRFAHAKLVTLGLKDMLFITWNTIRVTEVSLDIALASDDGQYLRTLLRILLLALQVHIVPSRPESEANGLRFPNPTEKIIQTVIDILTHLVASGVRSLAGSIHEAPNSSQPADLALLTSLLQACVRIPGIELHHATICSRLAEANTARVAATLFSWSDQLLINSEPVYGDISIRYLVELSGIPLMAGEIAADGVLSQLSNARLMRYIRAGLEPLNPQHHMLYDIWSRGILPLCLNLLTAVGPGIASDVAAFLSTFNQHLLAASSFFAAKRLTLSTVSEAHSLALITVILDKFRAAGPTMGSKQAETLQWDKTQVRVDLTEWIENRSGLRAAVTSTSEAQLRLADEKGKGDGSRLEDMVVHELLDCLVLLE